MNKSVDEKVQTWKNIFEPGPVREFVLFKNDTCIILTGNKDMPNTDVAEKAKQIMTDFGPVVVGTSAANFNIHKNPVDVPAWIVSYEYPYMLTYVSIEEAKEEDPDDEEEDDRFIGLYGRNKRSKDGKNPEIVHIEKL